MSNELRQKILLINNDKNLTPQEKSQKICALMNNIKIEKEKCDHYDNECIIYCNQCNKWYECHHCHNNYEEHLFNRNDNINIKCKKCDMIQESSNKCIKCNIEFGKYYCNKCNLWDNNKKDIFHCDKCKICRIGKEEELFHCDICNQCFLKTDEESHPCNTKNLNDNCPICTKILYGSQDRIVQLYCNHKLHVKCYNEYIKNDYKCPLCKKSVVKAENMKPIWDNFKMNIRLQPMPEEFKNVKVIIFCNDCDKESETNFHFIGHECQYCNSWNTWKKSTINHS